MNKMIPTLAAVALSAFAGGTLWVAHAANPSSSKVEANPTASTPSTASKGSRDVAYSFGYMMGKGNKDAIPDLDITAFEGGFKDAYAGQKPRLSEEQMRATLMAYKQEYDKRELEKQSKARSDNEAAGAKFLAENGKKPGVKTTASGLQYQIIKEGTGAAPKATDTVKVHYEGKLLDGKVFDSSIARNEPVTFPLNGVIPGWTEGVQLMKEGAKYRFFIPSKLAYGENGAGNSIPPNSTLIFEVELIKVGADAPAATK